MTRREQAIFVRALCGNIAEDIVRKIAVGMVPEEWQGHELRRLVRDAAADAVLAKNARAERAYKKECRERGLR